MDGSRDVEGYGYLYLLVYVYFYSDFVFQLIIKCRVVTRVLGVPYSTVVFLLFLLHGTSNPDFFYAKQ